MLLVGSSPSAIRRYDLKLWIIGLCRAGVPSFLTNKKTVGVGAPARKDTPMLTVVQEESGSNGVRVGV